MIRWIRQPNPVGRKTAFIPAAAFRSSITTGAAFAAVELSPGHDYEFFDFNDTVEETIQTDIILPKSWDAGTVSLAVIWTNATAVENDVVWGVQGFATVNGGVLDGAYGAEIEVISANNAVANENNTSSETAAITVAGAVKDADLHIKIARKATDVLDDLVGDARFIGICFFFNTDAATDA